MNRSFAGYRHSARFIRPFLRVLRRHPAMPPCVLDAAEAMDVDAWLTYAQSLEFCERAIVKTHDADLGLHAAAAIEPGDFDVLEYAARSSASFGEAIESVNRYIALLREGASFYLERGPKQSAWVFAMALPLQRVLNDWTVAVYCVLGRAMSDVRPLHDEAHFMHSQPSDVSEYERIVQCRLRFDMPDNRIVFPTSVLSLPIKGADERLHEVMQRYAGDMLKRRPNPATFRERVRTATYETLRSSTGGAAGVAERLGIGERTLNRRLRDEGTTYLRILEDLRRELAQQYLMQPELSIAEITFMLGFSQTPAFSRAFKRWTGISPAEYRSGTGARYARGA